MATARVRRSAMSVVRLVARAPRRGWPPELSGGSCWRVEPDRGRLMSVDRVGCGQAHKRRSRRAPSGGCPSGGNARPVSLFIGARRWRPCSWPLLSDSSSDWLVSVCAALLLASFRVSASTLACGSRMIVPRRPGASMPGPRGPDEFSATGGSCRRAALSAGDTRSSRAPWTQCHQQRHAHQNAGAE